MDNQFVIVSPSYNNENWVDTYYESIRCQTYGKYKVIYINDNSTDNTDAEICNRIENDSHFTYIKRSKNIGAMQNYIDGIMQYSDPDDIILNLDGDDWFATPDVLEKLNEAYNRFDYWITYGKMLVYNGTDRLEEANPQNTPYDAFVHRHQYYRRDTWRASHLRTYRKFLFTAVDPKDLISQIDGKIYWHASDLAFMYPMLEMTPVEKIGVIDFPTYVYNASKENMLRTTEREHVTNRKYETEIRNKKVYRRAYSRGDIGRKLPQVNFIGDYRERNSIPTKFTAVYGLTTGEFDITVIQDTDILRYINGDIKPDHGKIVADVHEPPYLFNQSEVYQKVYEKHHMFDKILTNNEELLTLPNAEFRLSGYEVVLNKNIHKQTYPILQDNSLMRIYGKSKIASFITSNKTFTPGHIFRIQCFQSVVNSSVECDVFGVGIREILGKIEALKDYRFSVAIENGQCKNYYTEKILDCFLTGTIPIYHGCPNISDFFDMNGIITFQTSDELIQILRNLDVNFYNERKDSIKKNFELANSMWIDNDRFFEKYIEKLL